MTNKLLVFDKSDVDWELARRAHMGTSWSPEKRADSYITGYLNDMQAAVDRFAEFITDDNRTAVTADLEAYRQGYLSRMNAFLSAHSRVVSTMITGPAKFPVERNRKRSDTADKRRDDWLAWCKNFRERMDKTYNPRRLANAPISADDDDAIGKLKAKIAQAEKSQGLMKQANKIVRSTKLTDDEKREQLTGLGFSDKLIHEFMTPDFMGKYGVPAFALTNNNANIRRMKARVEELEREQARQSTDDYEVEVRGMTVTVSENTAETRLQLFFDDKPPADVRAVLSANGFHFSRRQGNAWQRLLNDNARAAARRVLAVITDEEE